MRRIDNRGVTVMLVLAFMGIFTLILGTISSYALMQARYGRAIAVREQALHVSEAGLEYYRWFLNKNPSIMDSGSGLESPVSYTLRDPEGGELGSATVTAQAHKQCNKVQWVDITSRGVATLDPGFPRTLSARYMRPSVAEYSYVVNTNVWAGADRVIRGPYHSNGGIRMDGTHNAGVTSAVSTWQCTSSYNCHPTQNNAPGVLGSGSTPSLWKYPVSTIDFASIAVDFSELKNRAQNHGGIYYGPAQGGVNNRGYKVVFNSNGTFTLYRVNGTNGFPSYSSQFGNAAEHSEIHAQINLGTFTIPSSCSLLFFEDRVWLEGVVKGKVTVVAATPTNTNTSPDIYLNDNIMYATGSSSDGLTAIAERNVSIPLRAPDSMTIHGVFVAQSGHYGRDYFAASDIPVPA
jgi:hypothetical protein